MLIPKRPRQIMPITLRPYQAEDWPHLWPVIHATFAAGDTYAYAPESTEAEIHKIWIDSPAATYCFAK